MSLLDPEILQDFLTESGELLEQFDQDLITLEQSPGDGEILNQAFRALHTIKGSASFLALGPLVEVAHAAESALNAARNRVVTVDRGMMDLLLSATDTIKGQFDDLRAGRPLREPDHAVVHALAEIGEGRWPAEGAAGAGAPASSPASKPAAAPPVGERPLTLDPAKRDLLDFLASDLRDSAASLRPEVARLADPEHRVDAARRLAEQAEALVKAVDFFDVELLVRLASSVRTGADAAERLDDAALHQLTPRLDGALELLEKQASALAREVVLDQAIDGLCDRIERLATGAGLEPEALLPAGAHAAQALALDGVIAGEPTQTSPAPADAPEASPVASAPAGSADADPDAEASSAGAPSGAATARGPGAPAVEQTIRVEVGRLEALLNLVGELVLQKNRISALAREIGAQQLGSQEFREAVALSSGQLDRVTADMQLAVMRTRMQPLDKLFGKYPRLVRDLARKTGKKIRLEIEGGETEVDKSVIEELSDPLVHLLRNSADHGIEPVDDRRAAGKPEEGVIRLTASQRASHVEIVIADDGRGLHRERIARKAVERGLATEQEVAAMPDREVFRFILQAGFSTAEQVSDLSGRGVGMDVVNTNIQNLKGSIELSSTPGAGTAVTIRIPLTVAIMDAMLVGVGRESYAIPLTSIEEIVRASDSQLATIRTSPVIRLRGRVLPLVDGFDVFGVPDTEREPAPFAVVLTMDDRRLGLMVSRLIGQQEVVIKPLDDMAGSRGCVSGATVRDDGGVSLIVDVSKMFKAAERAAPAA